MDKKKVVVATAAAAAVVVVAVTLLAAGCKKEQAQPTVSRDIHGWPFDAAEAARRQRGTAEILGLPVEKAMDLGNGVKLELVLVPAGEFEMGSPEGEKGRDSDEGPVHRVRITKPFYIGKYEMTQDVWEKVMGNNPSNFKGARNPVEEVSWDDCQEFLRKLTALGKGTFRLPTEAEWEYACRAGSRTRFCFGDADDGLADSAWHNSNSAEQTYPVGQKRANAWGLYDMHGHVWEWCFDWYSVDYYRQSAPNDPVGPPAGSTRVLRGGYWSGRASHCRSAFRVHYGPASRYHTCGFRVVCVR